MIKRVVKRLRIWIVYIIVYYKMSKQRKRALGEIAVYQLWQKLYSRFALPEHIDFLRQEGDISEEQGGL